MMHWTDRRLVSTFVAVFAVSWAAVAPAESTLSKAAKANTLVRARQWDEAAALYAQIVKENPFLDAYWRMYATVNYHLGRHEEAINCYEKAIELGGRPADCMYNIACSYSLLEKRDQALEWLGRAIEAGFLDQGELLRNDSDLDAIRSDPRFNKLTGVTPPSGLTRDQAWRYDLDFFARRMAEVHFDLYRVLSKERFDEAVAELKRDVGKLKDHQIIVRLQRICAMAGDGHTGVRFPHHGENAFHRYPVEYISLGEEMYVFAAAKEHRAIVGGRILRFGKVTPQDAMKAVTPFISLDNSMWIPFMGPHYLSIAEVVDTLILVEDMNRMSLVVETVGGEQLTVYLKTQAFHDRNDFVSVADVADAPAPLWLKNTKEPFWFEHLEDHKLVFFQYNEVQNKPDEPIADFAQRLFEFIDSHPVDYLVIDMRHNGGGDNFLNQPIVHGLIKCEKINRRGRLFVIIGRHTFSAAMNGAVDIERNTHALFVGEPTGSSPNFVGEGKNQILPCSRVVFNPSPVYWQSSTATDQRTWIAPDIVAEPDIEYLRTNRDPAMEAILEYIREQTEEQSASR